MRKTLLPVLTICLTSCLFALPVALAQQRASIYPFDVKIGGQLATVEGNPQSAIFAKVKNPVPADADLEVAGAAGMLIVNVFPVKPSGEVPPEASGQTKILMVQEATKVKLDETMDKSRLTPGLYGANIVFNGGTSRVMFTVR